MFVNGNLPQQPSAFNNIGFSPRFRALLDRKASQYSSRDATLEELHDFSRRAHRMIPSLAGDQVLLALRDRNNSIFQVITNRRTGRIIGLNAQLPLTPLGREALLSGKFSPASPLAEYVARRGELVDAIYAWLVFSPRSYVGTIAGLAEYVQRHAPHGCAIFCRAAHGRAASLFRECGYERASSYYPAAPQDLLVVHPQVQAMLPVPIAEGPAIKIDIVRSLDDFLKVMAVRAATYLQEQECPFEEDYDGNDFCASHVLAEVNGEPAGCIRIRYFKGFVKFERLAVRHEFRTSKIAFLLVRKAMRFVAQKGFDRVYGHARHDLVRFWETFGFRPLPGRPKFVFSDIEFIEMEGPVKPAAKAIQIGDNPHHILRPEGLWDRPSIFERSINLERFNRVNSSLARRRA